MVTRHFLAGLLLTASYLGAFGHAWAQETEAEPDLSEFPALEEVVEEVVEGEKAEETLRTETATNEDPDAVRRSERELQESAPSKPPRKAFEWNLYGSLRLHAINNFDLEGNLTETSLGDGASRLGITGDWLLPNEWQIFGRVESGFDILDTFTPKAQNDNGGIFTPRLYNVTLETPRVYAKLGKSWSTYYKVAGAADRFSIFGGDAAGVYNAGTDGGATGTGRANNALQTLVYIDFLQWGGLKPFNLNVQYQQGEDVPQIEGLKYDTTWSFSAWFETERDWGIGLAYHTANIDLGEFQQLPAFEDVAPSQDALALAIKTYGDRWLAALVLTHLDDIETTDKFTYFDGRGAELFAQWQFRDKWWLIGGFNWLEPDSEEEQAGEYEVRYGVLGLRYTLDSFHRMAYAEWRIDRGTLQDGTPLRNEFTIGFRWDFGY